MTLTLGDRIGRFEVLGCLGVGGMGEVYRARDPQLQREVAIKILPAALSRESDRQRRFEQEARAAGSLNHPNIVAVYEVGVHDGATWIVTELLVGETLRQRMDGRPLSPRTVVDYAIQIASGLAAAHERGMVHRDVKPANLFVTTDGRIKILDFGIAKLIGPDASDDATETITINGVQLGPVVGTAIYMSPEQARGLRTDHRSDIFSFGTVLYEIRSHSTTILPSRSVRLCGRRMGARSRSSRQRVSPAWSSASGASIPTAAIFGTSPRRGSACPGRPTANRFTTQTCPRAR
jgi:eukaryotic-like serine/threonine-protein kinase